MTQIPAGWYPDPAPAPPGQPPQVRYWDGSGWTEHVSPAAPAAPVAQVAAPAYSPAPAAETGPTTPDGARLAGWWSRVGAYLIDGILLGVVSQIVSIPGTVAMQADLEDVFDAWETRLDSAETWSEVEPLFDDLLGVLSDNVWWLVGPSLVASMLYFLIFWVWKGATLGQMVLGIKVRLRSEDTGGGLPIGSAALRWLVMGGIGSIAFLFAFGSGIGTFLAIMGATGLFGLVNFLWPLFDDKRQAIHDKVARTNVVKVR